MSKPIARDDDARQPERAQSGAQIWLACLLFILVPTLIVLLIKYLLKV